MTTETRRRDLGLKAVMADLAAPRPAARLLRDRLFHPRSGNVMFAPLVKENPYQSLLYSAFSPRPKPIALARAGRIRPLLRAPVYHIHWDEFLFPAGDTRRATKNMEALRAFVRSGGKVLWTMHNAVPHDLVDPILIKSFRDHRRQLIELSSLVHVHSRAAEAALVSHYDVSKENVVLIPHPSYGDWYGTPAPLPPQGDRFELLVFGSRRGNRGLELIRSAIASVPDPGRYFQVTIAGSSAQEWQGLKHENPHISNIDTVPGFIPDENIGGLFAKANFSVFGFSEILTSGSLMLSLTMGVPPIAPDLPSIRELLSGPLSALLYRSGDPRHLAEVIGYAASLDGPTVADLRAHCLQVADAAEPGRVSAMLADAISALQRKH